jgi:hypothetical protein
MTTLIAEERDREQRTERSSTRWRPANEGGQPAGSVEPNQYGLPGAEPCPALAPKGRRGRQGDYL